MPPLNPCLLDTGSPPIPEIQHWGARFAGGGGLLNMCQAVPSHPPAPGMLERLARAAGDPACATYGPIMGDVALRDAYAAELGALYGGRTDASEVAITAGCNQAYFVAMMALAQRGDAVLLPTPWYFNHRMTLDMLGVEPRPLPCRAERGFVPDPEEAAARLDARVRAIVLVTPNNPTGAAYPPEVIARFHALCRERGIWLVLDETYRDFLPAAASPPHALFQDPAWRDGLVHLYSFSKAYCVPGHRVGAIIAGPAFRAELMKALDTWQICAARPAQAALAWGVPALAGWRAGNRDLMADRAAGFRAAVGQLPGWRLDSLGAYFAYLRVPEDGPDAMAMAERLAAERGLLCLPGPFFGPGQDRHIRLAFANAALEAIAEIPTRLQGALP
jgi:aspartate/methionine/tyrosine aminotransferase